MFEVLLNQDNHQQDIVSVVLINMFLDIAGVLYEWRYCSTYSHVGSKYQNQITLTWYHFKTALPSSELNAQRKKYMEINLGEKMANGHEFVVYVLCNSVQMFSIDDVTITVCLRGVSLCASFSMIECNVLDSWLLNIFFRKNILKFRVQDVFLNFAKIH